ncbi:hypothetical protein LUZ60_001172 [Juncus effusus]|nr:hypothetical protein LUZ60_001172 [Juncus effusus]
MAAWAAPVLPFLLVSAALVTLEELITTPSCRISGEPGASSSNGDLKVMMVADLLLRGSDASYVDLFIRDHFTSKFFTKSFQKLRPHMLIVLGDLSAQGSKLSESKWPSVLHQFHQILGPTFGLPLHIIMGDRDIGLCPNLREELINEISIHMPLLDPTGCSAFEIANISFLSLNSVSLLCGNNELRFSVERAVEKKSHDFQRKMRGKNVKGTGEMEMSSDFIWKENEMKLGTGPVVLLHFPLYKSENFKSGYEHVEDLGPYNLDQTLPANATEYILQALKPRIVVSAHAQIFSDHIHSDGTREITVPAMSQSGKGNPGFVFLTFGPKNQVIVNHCVLARELHVILSYLFLLSFSIVLFRTFN